MLNLAQIWANDFVESRTVLNLKRRSGPMVFGEQRRVELEAQIWAKDVVEGGTVLDFKSRFSAGQRAWRAQIPESKSWSWSYREHEH